MAVGRKDIYKDAKPFKKGDPRINRKGQPLKPFNKMIKELRLLGYEAVTSNEYHEFIGMVIGMTEKDLKRIEADETRPYWARATITDLSNKDIRQKIMDSYRDWLYGKAMQNIDHTTKGNEIKINIIDTTD